MPFAFMYMKRCAKLHNQKHDGQYRGEELHYCGTNLQQTKHSAGSTVVSTRILGP